MFDGKRSAAVAAVGLAALFLAAGAEGYAQEAPAAAETAADVPQPAADAQADPAIEPAADSTAMPAPPPEKPENPLVVASWGGVYSKSQEEAIFRPFTRSAGIEVVGKVYAGDFDAIREQVESGDVAWDVVDADPADVEQGCNEGLLLELDLELPAPDDFLPGTLHPCGVGSVAWAMVIAHDRGRHADRPDDARPNSLDDFFDLESYPGGRGLRRTPMANLEWALLADGADPAEVYDLLRSDAGIDRALAKLDTIRSAIVWWEDAAAPARLLAEGQVVMSSTYNAAIFDDIAMGGQPFELIWDRQIWDVDFWAIPAAAPNRQAALEFVRFATSSESLARQTRWIPYGPVRRSATDEADDFALAEIDIRPYLPTTAENMETALRNDALFWREHGPALVDRFNVWLTR